MDALTTASFVFATTVLSAVGLRLLAFARRTRQVPELAIGTGMAGAGLGAPGIILVAGPLGAPESLYPLWALANVVLVVGYAAIYVGTWWIFRRSLRWAKGLAGAGFVLATVTLAVRLAPGEIWPLGKLGPPLHLLNATGSLCFIWMAAESLRYHRMMRRRLALGLADPIVVQQFLLWGVAGGAAAVNGLIGLLAPVTHGVASVNVPAFFVILQVVMLVAAVGMGFAFFPPAFYRRYIVARAPAIEDPA